jgi:hypothetical protein
MGPQYQATVDSYAASPQAAQSAGNQTLGKAMEQSPVHNGFGTGSSMYDNDMDKGYQPAPVAMPPQPKNQPSSAGVTPSWAQQPRKRGGRAKRADGGSLAALFGSMANQPQSLMRTGDTVREFGQAQPMMAPAPQQPAPMPMPAPNQGQPLMPPTQPIRADDPQADTFPIDPYDVYLNQLYSQSFNRAPDEGGLNYWKDILKAGKNTPEEVKQSFLGSPEYKTRSALAQQNALMPGVYADQPGMMDPFVAGYLSRIGAAQNIYGNIAKQNYAASQEQQKQYQEALDALTKSGEQKLSEAEILKKQQDEAAAAAEAERQRQLLLFFLMSQR